jgi:hypothetical protein
MVKTGLTILALELIVVALVRSRYRSREQRQQPATTV